jgi:glyoxylase-like metal-dependent hydrolase (beta-lactamase superfamily II)
MSDRGKSSDGVGDIFELIVGKSRCIAIKDTSSVEKPEALFPELSPAEINELCNQYNRKFENKFEMICLIVNTGKNVILIDTGWGPGRDPCAGKLLDGLQTLGLSCSKIDTVIHTHGHPDHIGGNTDVSGRPVFPNARYVICKDEWEFWASGPDLKSVNNEVKHTMLEFAEKHVINIREQFDIVDIEAEIFPGIRYINTPGHTPGHTSLVISSGGEQLMIFGDVVHHPIQLIKPDIRMIMDLEIEHAIDSRIRILEQASSTSALVFACHFPFPGFGYIVKHKDTWLWHPVEENKRSLH